MNIDIAKAVKPSRKLRKMLKAFPADPPPDDVHSLRTKTRRLEAYIHAMFAADDPQAGKLLKSLKPLRKSAGKVRDMDVLLGKTYALHIAPDQECIIRLAEHLAGKRKKRMHHLIRAIEQRGSKVRKLLKKYLRRIRDGAADFPESLNRIHDMAAELEQWPKLHQHNLHEFRIHAKELRYMLQLRSKEDRAGIDAFGRIKDTAGDWHDWLELEKIAEEVLNPETDGAVLREIHKNTRDKLRIALSASNAVRRRSPARLAA